MDHHWMFLFYFLLFSFHDEISMMNPLNKLMESSFFKSNNKRFKPGEQQEQQESPIGISGSVKVEFGQAGFMVLLYNKPGDIPQLIGSGVVLDNLHILTSGMCCGHFYEWTSVDCYALYGGYSFGDKYVNHNMIRRISTFKVPETFLSWYKEHKKSKNISDYMELIDDICIVTIDRPISFDDPKTTVVPIRLPPQIITYDDNDDDGDNNWIDDDFVKSTIDPLDCWTFGFGLQWPIYKQQFGKLHRLKVPLVFLNSTKYQPIQGGYLSIEQDNCTEPHIVLPGDSGGPLICRLKNATQQKFRHEDENYFNLNFILMGLTSRSLIPGDIDEFNRNFTYIAYYEPIRFFRSCIDEQLKLKN